MPAATIREVFDQMDALLARWEPHGDYRAVFVRSYRVITIEIQRAIAAGEFEDPDWMTRLDIIFAQEYFDALEAYELGAAQLPGCWELVFDLAREKRSTALQDLTLGMIAHIVHDLPIALYKTGIEPGHRQSRRRDHEVANEILGRSIGEVQAEISSHYSFMLGFLDRLAGDLDEILTDAGIRAARDRAWARAVALTDAPNQSVRDDLLRDLARTSLNAARLLAPKPPSLLASLIPPFRRWDRMFAHWV